MARKPTIVKTTPIIYASGVPTTISIQIEFDIDLDGRYIEDFVVFKDAGGTPISGRIVYRKKIITFTPHVPLNEGAEYELVLIGDTNVDDVNREGLRSIVGEPMGGIFSLRFTTEANEVLPAPDVVRPIHHSILKEEPVFEWVAVEDAQHYEIQIATTNTFHSVLYPVADNVPILLTSVIPDLEWEDRIYYWRIRTVDDEDRPGLWSSVMQFNISRIEEGPIAEEDVDPNDLVEDFNSFELELIESFPKENSVQVPLHVHALYFRVIGDIDLTQIDESSFSLTGVHFSGDLEEESHGEVSGKPYIVNSNDGTTYLVFVLDPLPIEESE